MVCCVCIFVIVMSVSFLCIAVCGFICGNCIFIQVSINLQVNQMEKNPAVLSMSAQEDLLHRINKHTGEGLTASPLDTAESTAFNDM